MSEQVGRLKALCFVAFIHATANPFVAFGVVFTLALVLTVVIGLLMGVGR